MCDGLDAERPGIKKRLTEHLKDNLIQFQQISDRLLHINLYFYGIGSEYFPNITEEDLNNSKRIHADAFIDGLKMEIRKDLNLIWSVYNVSNEESESFYVLGY